MVPGRVVGVLCDTVATTTPERQAAGHRQGNQTRRKATQTHTYTPGCLQLPTRTWPLSHSTARRHTQPRWHDPISICDPVTAKLSMSFQDTALYIHDCFLLYPTPHKHTQQPRGGPSPRPPTPKATHAVLPCCAPGDRPQGYISAGAHAAEGHARGGPCQKQSHCTAGNA